MQLRQVTTGIAAGAACLAVVLKLSFGIPENSNVISRGNSSSGVSLTTLPPMTESCAAASGADSPTARQALQHLCRER
jgi:hypothetical protein